MELSEIIAVGSAIIMACYLFYRIGKYDRTYSGRDWKKGETKAWWTDYYN